MKTVLSNFGVLLDILEITPMELAVAIGADKTLISRWRSGERKLVSGGKWAEKIADYFLEVDSISAEPVLRYLIQTLYPSADVAEAGLPPLLRKWLSANGQLSPEYQENRRELLLTHFSGGGRRNQPSSCKIVMGNEKVKDAILEFLERIAETQGGGDMFFVCNDGLGLVTCEQEYTVRLMAALSEVFKSGKRVKAVLRTNFKLSEVSAFSGPWLAAHLSGHIESMYYDDFRQTECDKMIISFVSLGAGIVSAAGSDSQGVKLTLRWGGDEVQELHSQCLAYTEKASKRFHHRFFRRPDGFLSRFDGPGENAACFLFQKLPLFGVSDAFELSRTGFPISEAERVDTEFKPLFLTPGTLPEKTRIYHMFCSDAIDGVLDGGGTRSRELSEIAGRSFSVTPQMIVEQLNRINMFLRGNKNYHVCFMPEIFFEQLSIQIGVWGTEAAIGWLDGVRSAACRDYINTAALHGYCQTVWDEFPASSTNRMSSIKKISAWIKRAGRFGVFVWNQ